jgi:hypothetical protein
MRFVHFLALGGAVAASGCFSYVPVDPSEVSPGQEVRLRLTAEEAARYPDLRLRDARLMEGTVVETNDGEVVVEASIGAGDPTRGARVFVQQISVPRSGILEVELREVDKVRTGFLIVGGGAVITAVIIKSGSGFGGRDGPDGEVIEARRIPLVSFRLPLRGR